MGSKTKIEWCDRTWNPWRGCTHAVMADGTEHPGCANCYAETMSKRNPTVLGQWGKGGTRVCAVDKTWNLPLNWNKQAKANGKRERVFVNSLSDFFEDWRGPIVDHEGDELFIDGDSWFKPRKNYFAMSSHVTMDDLRRRAFGIIDQCDWLDFLILTKRPWDVLEMTPHTEWNACDSGDCPHWHVSDCDSEDQRKYRDNVWLLTSVSDQPTADALIPDMLKCRDLVPVLGLSCEPLLGPLDLTPWLQSLNWLIVGGESGPHARPMHPDWVRSIRDQCQAAGVPFFFKQGSQTQEWPAFKDFDSFPSDLQIREFPSA